MRQLGEDYMPSRTHVYRPVVEWTGNTGSGTSAYQAYERAHAISSPGKSDILGSSDPVFRGDATRWNPEELFVAAVSACHKLW
jgi:organic hydroperoxide reductase OsmC/OhrA